MEPVVSMAGLMNTTTSPAALGSRAASVRLLIPQSDQRLRAVPLSGSGSVRALLPMEDPRRSAFGRGAVSSRPTRLDVRV